MTELERALLHIKTRADAWAVKEVEKALSQEPITTTNNDEPITVIYPTTVCDDAISREELLKAIDTWDKFGYTETGCFVRITKEIDNYVPYVHLEDVITAIQKLPPVTQKSGHFIDGVHAIGYREGYKDAQKQKSGKWIETDDKYGAFFICDKCHRQSDIMENYCPNCGAKMESEE